MTSYFQTRSVGPVPASNSVYSSWFEGLPVVNRGVGLFLCWADILSLLRVIILDYCEKDDIEVVIISLWQVIV